MRAVLVVLVLVALAPAAVSASRHMMRGGMAREAIVPAEGTAPVGLGAVRQLSTLAELPALHTGRARKLLRVSSARAAVPLRRFEAPSPGPAAADSKPPLAQAMRKLLRERVAPAPAPVHLHEAHDARAPGPGASPGDGLPDVIAPATVADGSAMLRAFLQLHEPDPDAQGVDWHMRLGSEILDLIDAAESPPAAWWPLHDLLTNVSAVINETLFHISPSLASLVDLHEPQFVKFEATSFEYHRHLAGLGASGLEVNPCLVRLGTTGAVVAPTLINVAPTGVALGATGAGVSPTLISVGPKLISVGPSGGPGMPSHLAFTPVLINVSPTWAVLPAAAGVPPVLQDGGVKIDPSPGKLVVTPPVEPGAGAADRAAVAEAAAERAP